MLNSKGIVYKITNEVNGKCYIGKSTRSFNERYIGGIQKTHNKKLKDDINQFGIENFKTEILHKDILDLALLNELEKLYIKEHKSLATENGYNIAEGGVDGNPHAGKLDEEILEWKENISKNHVGMLGKTHSEKTKKKMSKNNCTKRLEVREKISRTKKGKRHSEETKHKISKNHSRPTARQAIVVYETHKYLFESRKQATEYFKIQFKLKIKNWFDIRFGIPKKYQAAVQFCGYLDEYDELYGELTQNISS